MADETHQRSIGGRGLGRGLSALLSDDAESQEKDTSTRLLNLPVAFLRPNPNQPRRNFDQDELKGLAASIAEKGMLQPILVRPTTTRDVYEIIAGERRWRAAQAAKLHEVPVIVRALGDSQSLEIAIIENVQRSDLNAIEEAAAYQELMERFNYTQEQVSAVVCKSRSHIANTLRLLKLSAGVKTLVAEGKLSAGHARALVGSPDPDALAKEILAGGLNVRQAEKKLREPRLERPKPAGKNADTKAVEHRLSNALGMNIEIEDKGRKGGTLKIHYRTLEQLDDIIQRLNFRRQTD